MPRLPAPPSNITGPLREYLQQLADAVRDVPRFSRITVTNPNTVVGGDIGDFALYVGSQSTLTRLWIKVSEPDAVSTSSWAIVRILG